MSQKVAANVTEGEWGDPILICGRDGEKGEDGEHSIDYKVTTSHFFVI